MKRTAEVAKLACPHCGGYYSRVSDTDPMTDGTIQRVRVCLDCHARYVTVERVISALMDAQPDVNSPHGG